MAAVYPPGFPLHMSIAGALGGWDRAPFVVSPLAAVACLMLFYAVARKLGLSGALATAGAAILAACPLLVGMAIQPMSDALATAWVLAAIACGLAARRRAGWAYLAGAAFGIAVLVRPTDVLAAPALALSLPKDSRALGRLVAGGLPFAAFLAAYDQAAFGSPITTGYGAMLTWTMSAAHFLPELRHYGYWLPVLLTPFVPAAWLLLPFDRLVPARDRALVFLWFAAFFLFYGFYEPYEDWWSARFLLPGIPAMVLAALFLARDASALLGAAAAGRAARRFHRPIGIALLAAIVIVGVAHVRRFDLFSIADGERVYRDSALGAAEIVPAASVIASMQMSGSVKYYTRLPILRWDLLDPNRFRELRQALGAPGTRLFALVRAFEEQGLFERAPGAWRRLRSWRDVSLWQLE